MGFIQRQGLKFSVVNLVGLLVSGLSTVYLYPYVLEEVGLLRFLIDMGTFIFPFISFGINAVCIRFFPRFEDKSSGHHGFIGLLLGAGLLGFILLLLAVWSFHPALLHYYSSKSNLYGTYLWVIVPLTLLTLFNTLFNQYAANFHRIVVPTILFDFSQKIVLPLLLLAYLGGWLNMRGIVWGIIIHSILVLIGFLWYLNSLSKLRFLPDMAFITPNLRKEMVKYAGFGMASSIGYMAVMRLDTIVVPTVLGATANGVYAIASFITNVLIIPMRAVSVLSGPLFSKYWETNNLGEIASLYKKASINILALGLWMFGTFWVSVDDFFLILPTKGSAALAAGKLAILLLALAKLYDLATGLNNYLLGYSRYYHLQLYSLIILAFVSVIAHWLLVPPYGLNGAAAAMLLMTVCYNSFSVGLIWWHFKMHPFSFETIKATAGAVILMVTINWMPSLSQPYVAIFLKSGLFALLYGIFLFRTKVSPELNDIILKYAPFLKRSTPSGQ
jgi:O-antigen/teichoic acid export membrane protein